MEAPAPVYGCAIMKAVVSDDVERMREVAKEAEAYLAEVGDLPAALAALRVEIARREAKEKTQR
jgi:hypothetical protein